MLDERTSHSFQFVVALVAAVALLFQCDLAGSVLLLFLVIPALAVFGTAYLLALDAMVAKPRGRPAGHLKTALVLAFVLGPAFPWVNIATAGSVHRDREGL